MPKRKVLPEPPPVLNPEAIMMRSMPLQQIVTILLNGSRSPQFTTVHPGLLRMMLIAYERRDTEAFIKAVQTYLEQAVSHVTQAGRREEIPGRIEALTNLIEEVDLSLVALRILRVVHAGS